MICFVASITIPVLSNTPFGNSCASYSMYSSFAGVPDAATAILTAVVLVPLLTMLTDTTLTVSAGTVVLYVLVGVITITGKVHTAKTVQKLN